MASQSKEIKFVFLLLLPTHLNIGSIRTFQRESEKGNLTPQFEQFVSQVKKHPQCMGVQNNCTKYYCVKYKL